MTRLFVVLVVAVLSLSVECLTKKGRNTMKLKKGDTNGGYGLNYSPPNYSSVVIWLHGLCGSAMDWERFVLLVNKKEFLPNTKWILPTSKFRKITAIYNNKCPAWFDITSFSPSENVEDVNGVMESARRIRKMVMSEIESGIDQSKIFLVGFSQGSAMALISSIIMRGITLGGVIGVSGWIPMVDHLLLGQESPLNDEDFDFNITDEKKARTNVFIFHGSKDNVIPFSVFLQTVIFMNIELGIKNINQRVYYNIGHSITALQGVHIMYEISKLIDRDNVHDTLVAVKNSTLSNSMYSMILKVSDTEYDNHMHYKFIPCNPNGDGEVSCSISNCNCTGKLTFYNESKFFDNLRDCDFGQFNHPYAIIQAVPTEKSPKSKVASFSSSESGSKRNGKPDSDPGSDPVTIDLDLDENTIPNLFSNGSNHRMADSNQEDYSNEMEVLNEPRNDSVPLPNLDEIIDYTSNDQMHDSLEQSSSKDDAKPAPPSTETGQACTTTNEHISFRKQGSFTDIMSHRLMLTMNNERTNCSYEYPNNATSSQSALYDALSGDPSQTIVNSSNGEEEKEEDDNGSGNHHHQEEESHNANAGTDINTNNNNTGIYDTSESNITGKIISNKISHYIKTPTLVKHRSIDDEYQQGNATGIEGGGGTNFSIPYYILLISNRSKYNSINKDGEVDINRDE